MKQILSVVIFKILNLGALINAKKGLFKENIENITTELCLKKNIKMGENDEEELFLEKLGKMWLFYIFIY